MAVRKDQIEEILDVFRSQGYQLIQIRQLLIGLKDCYAYQTNKSFATTIDRLFDKNEAKLPPIK